MANQPVVLREQTELPRCGYIALFKDKKIEIYANGIYKAQCMAIEYFKPSKKDKWQVTVALAELADGSQVVHNGCN
jgi:hypothetical protein